MGDTLCHHCGQKLGLSGACVEELGLTWRRTSSKVSQDLPLEASGHFKENSKNIFSSFLAPMLTNLRYFWQPQIHRLEL